MTNNPCVAVPHFLSSSIHMLFSSLCSVVLALGSASSLADFHGTLTATTNNAERWFSKSDNKVALIANIDYEHNS